MQKSQVAEAECEEDEENVKTSRAGHCNTSHVHKACVGIYCKNLFKGSWACNAMILVEKKKGFINMLQFAGEFFFAPTGIKCW